MLSITNAYSAEYLTRQVAVGAENYYTAAVGDGIHGEPPGIWTGRACGKLGLEGQVDNAVFERLVDGFWDPRDRAFLDSSVPDKEKARLGRAPRYYKTPDELYQAKLAANPDASPEERAQLWAEAQKNARQGSLKGKDATFSPPKSVTMLHAACQVKAQEAFNRGDLQDAGVWSRRAELVWEAVMDGNQAALDDLQDHAAQSRAGYHGKKVGDRVTGRYVDVDGFVVASFRQHTSRNEDPQLHIHNFILWRVDQGDENGGEKWRTPDSWAINKRRAAAAAIGERTMFERLSATLGVDLRRRADGHGLEIEGISQELMDAHSSRRAEVTGMMRELVAGYEERHGRAPSARALFQMAQYCTMETKAHKLKLSETPSRAELLAAWEDRTRATCLESLADVPDSTLGRVTPGQLAERRAEGYDVDQVLDLALAEVQAKRNSWGRAQLIQAIDAHLPETLGGLDREHVSNLLNELADEAVSPQRGAVMLANAPEVVELPEALLRPDGTSIYQPRNAQRYTSVEQVDREGGLLAAARAGGAVRLSAVRAARVLGLPIPEPTAPPEEQQAVPLAPETPAAQPEGGAGPVEPPDVETEPDAAAPAPAAPGVDHSPTPGGDSVDGAAGAGPGADDSAAAVMRPAYGLRPDQAAAVYGIVTDGRRISVLSAPAGAGKSYTVSALDKVWREHAGGRVIGLTTSQNASFVLHGEGLDDAHNITRFLRAIAKGREQVDTRDLLVVDEASMVSTEHMARLKDLAEQAGAKLLLTGDPEQLGAVGAGGMMRLISEEVGSYELTEVERFAEPWEADASRRLREGDVAVLPEYDARGRVREGTAEEMETKAYEAWLADHLSGRDSLLIAPDNAAAVALSGRARARLVELGVVEAAGVALRDGNAAGVGDLVMTRRNNRRIADEALRWVANRDVYRVTARRDDGGLEVERVSGSSHERGRRLVLPGRYVATETELAYAGTVHASQGRTVDTAHAIITGSVDRALAYVALTRARLRNMAYVVTDPTGRADLRPDARPTPQADPEQVDASARSPEETRARRAALLGAYEELRQRQDPRYGDRGRLAEVAGELAGTVPDLDPETARAWLDAHLGGRTALGVLADVLEVTEAEDDPTATEVIREEQDRVTHLAHLGPQWIDVTRTQRGELVEQVLKQTLTAEEWAKWQADSDSTVPLVKLLRDAENAGMDPADTLRAAVNERALLGDDEQSEARDIARTLYWRVERAVEKRHEYLAQHPDEAAQVRENVPQTWVDRTPADLPDPEMARVAREYAEAMDARTGVLADRVAAEPPAWARDHLGSLPEEDPLAAEEWRHKVGVVAGYVEQFRDEGEDVERDPVGMDPGPANPEAHAAWAQAARVLGLSVAQREIRGASLGELGRRRAAYERMLRWAPPHVADQLRDAHQAVQDFEKSVALLAAQARAADTGAERAGLAAQAARDARLAEAAGERVAQLTEIHATRERWIGETEQARQAAEAAGEEIRRRRTANPGMWRRTGAELPGLHETPDQRAERERVLAQQFAETERGGQVDGQMELPLDGAGQPTVDQQQRLDLRARTGQMRETLRRRLHGWLRPDRTDEVTAEQVEQATEAARQQLPGPHHHQADVVDAQRDQEARAEDRRRDLHPEQGSLFEVADEVQPDLREATAQADQARRVLAQREQQRQAEREQRDREADHTAKRMRERQAEPERAATRTAGRKTAERHLPGPAQQALDVTRNAPTRQADAQHTRHQPPAPKPPTPPQRGGGGRSL